MDELRPPGLTMERGVPPLRGLSALAPLLRLLPVLFLFSLAAGLLLRLLPGQPGPLDLMDVLGMLCWLLGYALAEGLQPLLQRLDRQRRQPVNRSFTRLRVLGIAVLAAAALSLAMLPVHFALDQGQELFLVSTLNFDAVPFRSGYFMLLLHFAVAPAYLLISAGLLRLLRQYLPAHPAALLWLLSGISSTVVSAVLAWHTLLPLSLGQFAGWLLAFMHINHELATPYIQELLQDVLFRLLGIWGLALSLCWLSLQREAQPLGRIRPLWLACCGGLLAAGLRTLALSWRWSGELAGLSPDNWWTLLSFGCCSAWTIWLMLCLLGEERRLMVSFSCDGAWLLLLVLGLPALTLASLQADESSRLTIASGLLLLLPLLLLGLLLPLQVLRLAGSGWQHWLLLPLAMLLLLPLPQHSLVLAMLELMRPGFRLPLPGMELLRVWFCLLVIVAIAWPGLLSALLARLRRRLPSAASV